MKNLVVLTISLFPAFGLAVEYPTIRDADHAAMLERFKSDRSKIDVEGFFTPPTGTAPNDCSMSEVDLYQLSGLEQAHPELKGKEFDRNARRFYRSAGAPGFKNSWENIRFIVSEMPCENGVPNGLVKVFVTFDIISDFTSTTTTGTSTSTMTMHNVSHTDRWVYRAVIKGVIQDENAMYSKQSTVTETHWSDPATEKAMQAVAKSSGTNRPTVVIGADYGIGNGPTLKAAGIVVMKNMPDISSSSGANITKFKDILMSTFISGMDDIRTVSRMYSDSMLQLISHTKNGKVHGDWLVYSEDIFKKMGVDWRTMAGMENTREVTIDGRAMLENRMCYQNGEQVKMSPCPSE